MTRTNAARASAMRALSRLEAMLETLFAGAFRELFPGPLQPVEIARALERAMLEHKVVAASSVGVPNRYEARLNPADYERLVPLQGAVERDAAVHLESTAWSQGLRPVGPVTVHLLADPSVMRSKVRPSALFDDRLGEPEDHLGPTRRMEPLAVAAPRDSCVLVDERGRKIRLQGGSVSLGRALDNDVVIQDDRVSRYHATLDAEGPRWRIRDLRSANGTFVGGRRVSEAVVEPGCVLSLGGYCLTFRGN